MKLAGISITQQRNLVGDIYEIWSRRYVVKVVSTEGPTFPWCHYKCLCLEV